MLIKKLTLLKVVQVQAKRLNLDLANNYKLKEKSSFHKMLDGTPNFHRMIDKKITKKYSLYAIKTFIFFI